MELPRAVAMTVKDEHSVVGPVKMLHRFFSKNGGVKRVGGLVIQISRINCKEAYLEAPCALTGSTLPSLQLNSE